MSGEALELASVARARGLVEVAGRLEQIGRLATERSPGLASAIGALAAHLRAPPPAPLDRTFVMKAPAPPGPVAGAPATRPPPAAGAPAARPGEVSLPPLLDEAPGAPAPGAPAGPKAPTPFGETVVLSQRSAGVARAGVAAARSQLPDTSFKPSAPQLLVKSMLNFRGFKKDGGASPKDAPPPLDGPKPAPGGVLGLGRKAASRPEILEVPSPVARRAPSRTPSTGSHRSEGSGHGSDPQAGGARFGGGAGTPRVRNDARARGTPPWVYLLGGGLGAIALGTVVVVAVASRHPSLPLAGSQTDAATTAGYDAGGAGGTAGTTGGTGGAAGEEHAAAIERVEAVVHGQGEDTPQLRALLDIQSRMVSNCNDDPARCARGWARRSRDALEVVDAGTLLPPSPSPDGPRAAWLQRLKMPHDFPVQDAPSLRGVFDYETKNIAGRQHFQSKVFDCAAYADIFDDTLVKYGAPSWLTAVVFQESGCNPTATSEVGAKGLWQFMPESARAYGLRVVDDEVDERLNPVKSTEAAIHFLTDLQRKLGAWDLALAAYNMGPFAVTMRIAQVGGKAGFWDLERAGLLPEETAAYVPAIEAHALVLENLGRLQFSNVGKRPESTAEIMVKAGTRLSLVARAAATTTLRIRELNPEFLRDVVPDGEVTARVPDDAHRAQTFLETLPPDDEKDLCVPENFDWGAQNFETSKYAAACTRPAPVAH
jgi:hypothetical protein